MSHIGWRTTKFVRNLAVVAIAIQFFLGLLHLIVGEWDQAAWYMGTAIFIAVVATLAVTVGTLAFKPKQAEGTTNASEGRT